MNKESLAEYYRRNFRLNSLRTMLSLEIFFVHKEGNCRELRGHAGNCRDKVYLLRSQGEKYLFEFLSQCMQFVVCGCERRNYE